MNIYNNYLKLINNCVKDNKKNLELKDLNNFKGVILENPPTNFNYDFSTNICLVLGKLNKLNSINLAKKIKKTLEENIGDFSEIEVAAPGFLNLNLSKKGTIRSILKILSNDNYGSIKENKNYNIEFVSANPTGPLHVGHCRGAVFGDVLSNLLIFNGNKVTKEYYVNDYGNQIQNFLKSVYLRIREIKYNEKFTLSENIYPGLYIIEIAKKIIKKTKLDLKNYEKSKPLLGTEAIKSSMEMIKEDLDKLGIKHDNFISERSNVEKKLVEKAIKKLKNNNYVIEGFLDPPKGEESKNWKKTKKLVFKSSLFGDDTDRALQKDDGSWTYFANDVAYHFDKVSRNYDYLINVLGADHTGYIKRIAGAVSALSETKTKLYCKVCQLVKLFKKGKPFKMSKRAGDFITVSDLLNEVDKDSIRFMMLNRSNDVEIDFDFDKVLEKTKENPVFYVQYCYARICSLFRTLKIDLNELVQLDQENFNLNLYEKKILRKIYEWPKVINISSQKLEPHRIPYYLYDLSTLFHAYWSKGNENEELKFINNGKVKNKNTLVIIKLISIVVKNGMNILGVSLPKKM